MVLNSIFEKNQAKNIAVLYSVLANQTLIQNCQFIYNTAENDVGVLSLTNNNQTDIIKSTFTQNTANKKGVFQIDTKSNVTIADSIF